MKSIVYFIIDKILLLGPPIHDQAIFKWKKNIEDQLKTNPSYESFLPDLFKEIMKRINHIKYSCEVIRNNIK